jgi:hypothetical protein
MFTEKTEGVRESQLLPEIFEVSLRCLELVLGLSALSRREKTTCQHVNSSKAGGKFSVQRSDSQIVSQWVMRTVADGVLDRPVRKLAIWC